MKCLTRSRTARWLVLIATLATCLASAAQHGEAADGARATTVAAPAIPVDELALRLTPLSRVELADEAEGWRAMLRAKAVEITAAEIAVKRNARELQQIEILENRLDAADAGDASAERQMLDAVSTLAALEAQEAAEGQIATAIDAAAARQHRGPVADAGETEQVRAPPVAAFEATARALLSSGELQTLVARTNQVEVEKEAIRALLFDDLDALRAERGALIERFQVVLDAWREKGGDTADHELYIGAVDGVSVDVSDTVTAWTSAVDWSQAQLERLGDRISGALFDIVVMVLIASAVWVAVKSAVKRHVAADPGGAAAPGEGDGGGAGATRLETLLPLLRKFIAIALIAIVLMISLSSLGVDVAPLLAGAGMVGIAVGFGAQTLVRDVVSGLFFLLDDAFRMGEYVEIDVIRGTVEKISVRSLQLRHHNGPVHTVPFGEIRHLTNYSRDYAIMKFEIRLPFETDIDRVRKIIKRTGQEMMDDETLGPMLLAPLKSQGVNRMDDSALIIRCKLTARPGDQFVLRREAYVRIQQALGEAGIHFAPRRVIVETASAGAEVPAAAARAAAGSLDTDVPGSQGADRG